MERREPLDWPRRAHRGMEISPSEERQFGHDWGLIQYIAQVPALNHDPRLAAGDFRSRLKRCPGISFCRHISCTAWHSPSALISSARQDTHSDRYGSPIWSALQQTTGGWAVRFNHNSWDLPEGYGAHRRAHVLTSSSATAYRDKSEDTTRKQSAASQIDRLQSAWTLGLLAPPHL